MAITPADVLKLFPQDNQSMDIQHLVDDASTLVGELLATSSLSSDRIDLITKYVAAHFFVLANHEGGIFEEQIGESQEKRGSTFTLGQGFRLTRWGQMALGLDSTGALAGLEGGIKRPALFRVV